MKLLMVSGDRSLAAGKRGAFYYTLEEFSKHWDRIDILCPQSEAPDRLVPSPLFGKVYVHPSSVSLWKHSAWIQKKGTELFAAHHHDVMTVHEYPPFYNGCGAAKLHRKLNIPYAIEIHHVVGHPVGANLTERLGRILSRIYLASDVKAAAAVRTVNHSVKTLLTSYGIPATKISIVPSFYLDTDILRPDASAPKMYDIAFCARLVPNKGIFRLLEALVFLPHARLVIIGDGPLREAAERKAGKLGIYHQVMFAGWLPTQDDVVRTLQSSKVFVMNSLSEGGPRTALEAMACGLPVISTKVGVMPEVIEDGVNGTFTTGEPKNLSAKIHMLLSHDELRERLGTNARRIIERFERKKLIAEYAAFLQKLAL